MIRLLSMLLLSVLVASAEDSPFRGITFQKLQFDLPNGKVLVVSATGAVTWPLGAPGADTQAFADALVTEKGVNPATVNPRVNKDDNASADYDNSKAITDWNELVTTLKTDGKPKTDNTKQARAVWKCLRKLFPHVFQ